MLAQFLENVSDEKRDCVFLKQNGSIAQSKPPEFAYINTCRSTLPDTHFIYLSNKQIYSIFKICCILCFI